jgi:hypothetical protein
MWGGEAQAGTEAGRTDTLDTLLISESEGRFAAGLVQSAGSTRGEVAAMSSHEEIVSVGRLTLDRSHVLSEARDYLRDGRTYAYPAYDTFEGGAGPYDLSDGDLLAYALLNVPPRLPAYYSLRAARPQLLEWLRRTDEKANLLDANESDLQALGKLFAILDGPGIPGVRGTILAKVMHRKRPHLVPLYDQYVHRVYVGHPGAPLQPDHGRSWAAFIPLLAQQIRDDLRTGLDFFEQIAGLGEVGPVTPLRALDIVTWQAGRKLPSGPGEPEDASQESGYPCECSCWPGSTDRAWSSDRLARESPTPCGSALTSSDDRNPICALHSPG